MSKKIYIFDSTLRDGAQAEGISFSVEDKIRIVKTLDDFGIDYIEAGNPTSNPKDLEFFESIKEIKLTHSKLVAFGSTRRPHIKCEEDKLLSSLLKADTEVVAIFGKSWDLHLTDVIRISLAENLDMIKETIEYLKANSKEVVYDAEHFFDGYKDNPEYAIETIKTACQAGADTIVLCDTNGGTLPHEVTSITKIVKEIVNCEIGIHAHNDSELAVANSIAAVIEGASQVQGTFIGFGERCGNANLSSIIPSLQLKLNYNCIPFKKMEQLTSTARSIAETSNLNLSSRSAFVGNSAFAHKGGMHIDGVLKNSKSFEHIDPSVVGNDRRMLVSEVAGRSFILKYIQEVDSTLTKNSKETIEIMERIKELEHAGYQFEGAESSVKLLIRKCLGLYKPFFTIENFRTVGLKATGKDDMYSSASVKINVNGVTEITADEGDGPVNALDGALRKALEVFYPELKDMHLTDYKVRIINTKDATAATTRVLIESSDGIDVWSNVGVSTDIIEASLIALIDSIEYKLMKDKL